MHVAGSKTGRLVPTGTPRDTIDGIEVSCIDAAMLMVLARADSWAVLKTYSEGEENLIRFIPGRNEADRWEKPPGCSTLMTG